MKRSIAALLIFSIPMSLPAQNFRRGDANADSGVDISDAVRMLGILFVGENAGTCDDARDANDDGNTDITDAVFVLNFLFKGGPAPPPPVDCGADSTEDSQDCVAYADCSQFDCYDDDDLAETIADNLPDTVCIDADAARTEVLGFDVEVCPSNEAGTCGPDRLPGCPVILNRVEGRIEVAEKRIVIEIEGLVDNLPIVISNFLTSSTCSTDIAFSTDAIIDLQTRTLAAGVHEITGTMPPRLENVEASLTASGGVLCDILESQQDLFLEELIGQIENVSAELLADLDDEIIGVVICED